MGSRTLDVSRRLAGRRGVFTSRMAEEKRLRRTVYSYWPRLSGHSLTRLGGEFDGGYLVPDCLDGVSACLSPGVDQIAKFERDLQALGIGSHLADASVDGPPTDVRPVSFTKKYLGSNETENEMTLAQWVADVGIAPQEDLILQMDIEGHEYATLLAAPRKLINQFRIIVIELHHLNSLGNRAFLQVFESFTELLTAEHTVVHAHPNNILRPAFCGALQVHPCLEVTLLRNDCFSAGKNEFATQFPHPLDRPCVAGEKDWPLSSDWRAPSARPDAG